MKGTLEANFDNVKSVIPFEVDNNMSDEEIADYYVDLIKEEINRGYPHRDPNGSPGADFRLTQNASPIFIPKRKKFKRRCKR